MDVNTEQRTISEDVASFLKLFHNNTIVDKETAQLFVRQARNWPTWTAERRF